MKCSLTPVRPMPGSGKPCSRWSPLRPCRSLSPAPNWRHSCQASPTSSPGTDDGGARGNAVGVTPGGAASWDAASRELNGPAKGGAPDAVAELDKAGKLVAGTPAEAAPAGVPDVSHRPFGTDRSNRGRQRRPRFDLAEAVQPVIRFSAR